MLAEETQEFGNIGRADEYGSEVKPDSDELACFFRSSALIFVDRLQSLITLHFI